MQIAKGTMSIAACRRGERMGHVDSLLPVPHSLSPRRGLTLVELLITITIIAVLASMILGVASVAGETAREAHTRHMITRLHTLLMQHLDTYKTRRVKLNPLIELSIQNDSSLNTVAKKGQARAAARLNALREMMLMEIPDRWSDIALAESEAVGRSGTPSILYPIYVDPSGTTNGRTELGSAYLRRYLKASRTAPDVATLRENQGAECLYLIITIACGDGEARTLFHESDIGDTDGDGAPEFLDGWGHPINFIRWAPGFDSEIQLNANTLGPGPPTTYNNATTWVNAANGDHDPYDLFRSDPAAFRLLPLIYSGGRDETFGLWVATGAVTWMGRGSLATLPTGVPVPAPYAMVTDPDTNNTNYLGTAVDGTATDNINNHLLGKRR
jgi:prepilin-type N-terminal cleavage/methylation domain-containing protein